MNRSALNSSVLGSGKSSSRVMLSVTEIIELAGALRVSVIKCGKATSTLTLNSSIRLRQKVTIAFESALSVAGEVTASIRQRVYFASVEFIRVVGSLVGYAKVRLSGESSLSADGLVSATVWHRVAYPVTGYIALEGTLSGNDIYTGLAPVERTESVAGSVRSEAAGD